MYMISDHYFLNHSYFFHYLELSTHQSHWPWVLIALLTHLSDFLSNAGWRLVKSSLTTISETVHLIPYLSCESTKVTSLVVLQWFRAKYWPVIGWDFERRFLLVGVGHCFAGILLHVQICTEELPAGAHLGACFNKYLAVAVLRWIAWVYWFSVTSEYIIRSIERSSITFGYSWLQHAKGYKYAVLVNYHVNECGCELSVLVFVFYTIWVVWNFDSNMENP